MCASAPIQSQILPILSQGEQAWLLFAVLELHVCVFAPHTLLVRALS